MRLSARVAMFLTLAAVAPLTAAAQTVTTPAPAVSTAPTSVSTAPVGPTIEAGRSAFAPASTDSTADVQRRTDSANLGQSRAMMIAGGAAVIVGIIIGNEVGTVIAVGGAIVGLYGLYQYLK